MAVSWHMTSVYWQQAGGQRTFLCLRKVLQNWGNMCLCIEQWVFIAIGRITKTILFPHPSPISLTPFPFSSTSPPLPLSLHLCLPLPSPPSLTQIPDYLSLDQLASKVGSILIVGGGFLGSELAVAIASRGKNTESGCQQVWGGGELVKVAGEGWREFHLLWAL